MYKYKFYNPDESYGDLTRDDDYAWLVARTAHMEYVRVTKKLLNLELELRERLQDVKSDMHQRDGMTDANYEYAEELRDTIGWLTNATLDLTGSNFREPYPLSSLLSGGRGWNTYEEKLSRLEESMKTINYHIRVLAGTYDTHGMKAKELLNYEQAYPSYTWEAPIKE